ncbi:MAG: MBL fold metallo-hydrolase [Saprospiraceae bacterium]|nr:MBL fold metallo-hydrolase [Saprospiraceae bacterium]
MKVEQIYTGCLAQGAYYIVSEGEAAIIDPLREIQPYLDRIKKDGVRLKYVFETHFHADFVSGHLDLKRKTNAEIVYGPNAECEFECISAVDGQIFELGKVKFKVLHTPGHTMESTCFLLIDENNKNHAIFSGDTLFLGDVGRPDLAQKASSMSQEDLAGMLYDSLMTKIIPLEDDVIVYPAHGAGSACGKNMMKETVDSLGNQKKVNYALNQPDRDTFIKEVTAGLLPPPGYFGANVSMNKKGYENVEDVIHRGLTPLNPEEFERLAESSSALILDTRDAALFYQKFIPQSINIGLKGDFAPWVGSMIVDVKQAILLVAEEGTEEEALIRLSRVGFDHVLGYLKGGIQSWEAAGKELDRIDRIGAESFKNLYQERHPVVLDVRKESEYDAEHVEGSINKPLSEINDWIHLLDPNIHYYIHCAGGYRSMIAGSILQARGFRNFSEVEGGFNAIRKTAIPVTQLACKSKLS